MSALLKNAVDSLAIGVEDFSANDPRRTLSAVRNFYAGAVLLAKEALIRGAPNANPDEIIGARYKPVPDGAGGVTHVQDGAGTIDFQTIGKRFKDFGIKADPKRLEQLNRIRNDIEHRYSTQTDATIREAIAMAFPLVSDLFREIGESPVKHLGDSWQVMLETAQLYEQELALCRQSLDRVTWLSDTMAKANPACLFCGSGLVAQDEPAKVDQGSLILRCKACGEHQETIFSIEQTVVAALETDAYLRVKDEGRDGPLFTCPECDLTTFIDFEDQCAACGFVPDSDSECARCGSDIELDIRLHNGGGSLCGYCIYAAEKVMRE